MDIIEIRKRLRVGAAGNSDKKDEQDITTVVVTVTMTYKNKSA